MNIAASKHILLNLDTDTIIKQQLHIQYFWFIIRRFKQS